MKKRVLPIKIEGRRSVLRKYHPKMAAEIFDCVDRDRAHLGKFLLWVKETKTSKNILDYIKYSLKEAEAGRGFTYAVFNKKSGDFMGVVSVFSIEWESSCCEMGYWITSDFEGRGFISDAMQALETACFKKGFHRIEVRCDARNRKSAAVPKRLGYKLDGKLVQNIWVGDRYRDTLIFGKVKLKSSRASGRAG